MMMLNYWTQYIIVKLSDDNYIRAYSLGRQRLFEILPRIPVRKARVNFNYNVIIISIETLSQNYIYA